MLSNNTDYQNNLLNRLAYVDFKEDWNPGDNLILAVERSGDTELAGLLREAGFENFVIKDYENDNTTDGFAAVAFEDPTSGETGISFRGTENLSQIGSDLGGIIQGDKEAINNQIDMIDNVSTAITGDSAQARKAIEFFENNQSPDEKNYLYGHSKGGELASEVYARYYKKIKEVHVINPQPIDWASLSPEQKRAFNDNKFDAIVVNGDLVWMLGGVVYNVRIVKNNGSQEGFFGPHNLESATYDPITGKAVIETDPYKDYMAQGVAGLGAMILISVVQAGYELGSSCIEMVSHIYNFIEKTVVELAKAAYEAIVVVFNEVRDLIGGVVNNITSLIDQIGKNISDWWNRNFKAGYKYANANPYVEINTSTMRTYASTLQSLSARAKSLDGRMNSLYWHLGIDWSTIINLGKLLSAGIILDFAYRLDKCANYLETTASDFENAEKDIIGNC